MKKTILTLFIILLTFSLVFIGCQQTPTGSNINIISRPVFGELWCGQDENPTRTFTQEAVPEEGIIIPSSFFGDISEATITVVYPSASFFSDTDYIFYKICNIDGSGCRINWVVEQLNTPRDQGSKVLGTISRFEQMEIKYGDICLIGSSCKKWIPEVDTFYKKQTGLKFTAEYTNYVLWRRDIFNPTVKVSETCANPAQEVNDEQLALLTSSSIAGQTARTAYTSRLAPEERWSYIAGFTLSPMETEIFQGQEAYCTGNNMYGFDTITTTNGLSYKIADFGKFIARVDCCDGDVRINEVCQDHEWISIEQAECSILSPCPISTWSIDAVDPARKTIFKQNCVDEKCVKETKTVECASSFACPEGEVCHEFECKKTGSSGGGIIPETCGNKICEGKETYDNCPTDCKAKCAPVFEIAGVTIIPRLSIECMSWWSPFIWIISILSGLIVLYFIFQFSSKRTPNRGGLNAIISIIFGLGAGILVYIYWWVFILILIILILIKMLTK